MFGRIGWLEVVIIVAIVILIFGRKFDHSKLPEIGKAIGKTIREFKKAFTTEEKSKEEEKKESQE